MEILNRDMGITADRDAATKKRTATKETAADMVPMAPDAAGELRMATADGPSRTDVLRPDLRVLFIGFNPSPASYQRAANYAGRSNRFYRVLYLAGITPVQHVPEDSRQFADRYGFGFTNLSPRPTARADELTADELRAGAAHIRALLATLRPQVACYVGKGVYTRVSRRSRHIPWGFQPPENSVVPGVTDFVGPSTSGLVRMRLEEQVAIYRALGEWLKTSP